MTNNIRNATIAINNAEIVDFGILIEPIFIKLISPAIHSLYHRCQPQWKRTPMQTILTKK